MSGRHRRGRHRRPPPRWPYALAVAAAFTVGVAMVAAPTGPVADVSVAAPTWLAPAPTTPTPATTTPTPTTTPLTAPPPTTAAATTTARAATTTPEPTTRRAPAPPPSPAPEPTTSVCAASGFGGVRPHVARAGYHLAARFGLAAAVVEGLANRPSNPGSDHPRGLALDFPAGRALGDDLSDHVLELRVVLAVRYVIWRQRINFGDGWEPMGDRGDVTANHFDHVHVSFDATPGAGLPC